MRLGLPLAQQHGVRPVRGRGARAVPRAAQAMMAAGPRDDGLEEALAAVAAAQAADARRRENGGHPGRARVLCVHRRSLNLCVWACARCRDQRGSDNHASGVHMASEWAGSRVTGQDPCVSG